MTTVTMVLYLMWLGDESNDTYDKRSEPNHLQPEYKQPWNFFMGNFLNAEGGVVKLHNICPPWKIRIETIATRRLKIARCRLLTTATAVDTSAIASM
ncbi:hypothetical protein T265_09976 [Opisthorchis viverrini]|uniref:Uncharacterized protein n=1 Tax=Opisthorchis viverrini TaxID=6198 RepID=A0A074Z3Y1_OPIVI|nr:hypothetical protein T265_09976 [Opisthorchis viverrini]KER21791.1 hypothetical protein T265_09976 [Opisthorchis viverrini]